MRHTTPDGEAMQVLHDESWRLLGTGSMRLSDLTEELLGLPGLDFLRSRLQQSGQRVAQNSVGNPLAWDSRFCSGQVFTNEGGEDDQLIARVDVVMTGRVFTTQITAADSATDSLCVDHDLVAFDELLCAVDDFSVNGNPGTFTIDEASGRREIRGSAGWLDDMAPGAMVTVCWHGDHVRVARCAERLEIGPAESEALLRFAADERPRYGFLVAEPVMRQLVDDPAAYSSPIAPITEMMRSGGFEHRGSWFGRATCDWNEPDIAQALDLRSHIADEHSFDECCLAAFDELLGLWDRHLESVTASQTDSLVGDAASSCRHDIAALLAVRSRTAVGAGGDIDYAAVSGLLRHESVADGFHDAVRRCIPNSAAVGASVLGFVRPGLDADPLHAAGLLHLAGRIAEGAAEFEEATAWYEGAYGLDPSFPPPCVRLAMLAFDRSRFGQARQWLSRAGLAPGAPEYRFLPSPPTGNDRPERNARCPCGSGRKYKACHAGEPALSAWQRLQLKYDRHQAITKGHVSVQMKAFMACDLDAERADRFIGDRFLADLHCFEGAGLATFAQGRSVLFPADELELLELLAGSSRQAHEVMRVADGRLWLRRIGDEVDVASPGQGAMIPADRPGRSVGDRLLARLVDTGCGPQIIGEVLDLPADATPPQIGDGVDRDPPDANDWAKWYIANVEASRQCATL